MVIKMKGYLYTLEVLIAVSIVFAAVFFVYRSPPQKPDAELVVIKQSGFDALKYLDGKGDLGMYASQNNETAIETAVSSIIPRSIGIEAKICYDTCSQAGIPMNQTVIAVDYYVSGYRSTYDAKKVRLYLWKSY